MYGADGAATGMHGIAGAETGSMAMDACSDPMQVRSLSFPRLCLPRFSQEKVAPPVRGRRRLSTTPATQ